MQVLRVQTNYLGGTFLVIYGSLGCLTRTVQPPASEDAAVLGDLALDVESRDAGQVYDSSQWEDRGANAEANHGWMDSYSDVERTEVASTLFDGGVAEDARVLDGPSSDWADVGTERSDRTQPDAGPFTGMVRQVVANDTATCAVMVGGEVYCWGFDFEFNWGTPYQSTFRPRLMDGYRDITNLSLVSGSGCGVDRAGDVWCSGINGGNALTTSNRADPLRVADRRTDVSGASHVAWFNGSLLAVQLTDGTLYIKQHLLPVLASYSIRLPTPAIDVKGGAFYYCVVLADGRVACYGHYVAGDTIWPYREGPRVVEGLDNVVSVAVGGTFYCALKRDGTVWCWGGNVVGQTGTPPLLADRCDGGLTPDSLARQYYSCVLRPRQVAGLTEVVEVAAGDFAACARRRDGTVWCWGDNSGQLIAGGNYIGDGLPPTELCPSVPWDPPSRTPAAIPCRATPSRVVGLTGATALSVGASYACAALSSGQIWCWGRNAGGILGDGTDVDRPTPVPVLSPL